MKPFEPKALAETVQRIWANARARNPG
jgi:hypothetical protein